MTCIPSCLFQFITYNDVCCMDCIIIISGNNKPVKPIEPASGATQQPG